MSRTHWIIVAVVVVVLALIAWQKGWLSGLASADMNDAAAIGLLSDAAATQLVAISNTEIQAAFNGLASAGKNVPQSAVEAAVTRVQVSIATLTGLRKSLESRAAAQNTTVPPQAYADYTKNLDDARAQLLRVTDALRTTKKLDPAALSLAVTRLQAAISSLQLAQANATAIAKIVSGVK